jgi:hypothetical protein
MTTDNVNVSHNLYQLDRLLVAYQDEINLVRGRGFDRPLSADEVTQLSRTLIDSGLTDRVLELFPDLIEHLASAMDRRGGFHRHVAWKLFDDSRFHDTLRDFFCSAITGDYGDTGFPDSTVDKSEHYACVLRALLYEFARSDLAAKTIADRVENVLFLHGGVLDRFIHNRVDPLVARMEALAARVTQIEKNQAA